MKLRQGTDPHARKDSVSPKVIPKGQRMIWGERTAVTDVDVASCNRYMF